MDAFEMRDDHDLKSALEAMLFVTSDPIETEALSAFLEEDVDRITVALKELQETYQQQDRGIQLNERAGGWQLVTHPRYHELLEQYVVSWDKRKLSQAALETLAIVAYCQPVTRNDVSAIRCSRRAICAKRALPKRRRTPRSMAPRRCSWNASA